MTASPSLRHWVIDLLIGGPVGAIIGAIVAVNVVIFSGIERGYESGIGEIFEYSRLLGIATVIILVAGPVTGVIVARRWRKIRGGKTPD